MSLIVTMRRSVGVDLFAATKIRMIDAVRLSSCHVVHL